MGCAADVSSAFQKIDGVIAWEVRPNQAVKLGASRELTEEELSEVLPPKYEITAYNVIK